VIRRLPCSSRIFQMFIEHMCAQYLAGKAQIMPSLPLGDILIFHRRDSGTHADYKGNGTPQALGHIVISDRLDGARGERVLIAENAKRTWTQKLLGGRSDIVKPVSILC